MLNRAIMVWCFRYRFRNYVSFKYFFLNFREFLKKKKKCNSENIKDFRKFQRQIYCKIAQVSLKPFSSKIWAIEFHIQFFKDLKRILHQSGLGC